MVTQPGESFKYCLIRWKRARDSCQTTERLVTIEAGANRMDGNQPAALRTALLSVLNSDGDRIRVPKFWDDQAAARIVDVLMRPYSGELTVGRETSCK